MAASFRGVSDLSGDSWPSATISQDNVLKRNYDYPFGIVWGQG